MESTNKVIEAILTKTVKSHRRNWADRIPKALWTYHTTWRNTIGFSPYELVYGKNVVSPVEFDIKTLRTALEANMDLIEAQKDCLNQLKELNEKCVVSIHHTLAIQHQCSKWHDRFIKKNMFHEGDWTLLYASWFKWYFKGKLRTRWLGPYIVDTIFDNETVRLNATNAQHIPLFSNVHQL